MRITIENQEIEEGQIVKITEKGRFRNREYIGRIYQSKGWKFIGCDIRLAFSTEGEGILLNSKRIIEVKILE